MDPFSVDFSALRTLRAVHDHGGFSRAAEKLGLTQPTVSYTIARLRETFHDPLFVRQGAGTVPTERCTEIVAEVREMTDRFEALVAPRAFDPASARINVAISCNYYERLVILPEVVRILRREAPGIKLRIIPSTVRGREQLTRSESDILLGPIEIVDATYFRRALLSETYTCVMDPANPLAAGGLDMDGYVAAPQVIVNYGGNFRSRFLVVMEAAGHAPNEVMEVPSPADLPELITGTDVISTVPTRIARFFGERVTAVPCPVEAEIEIGMYWTARTHRSAPHVWLRDRIASVASGIVARERAAPRRAP